MVKLVQAKRDDRVVNAPSTVHRADGTRVPRNKLVDSKRQRDLSHQDVEEALRLIMKQA